MIQLASYGRKITSNSLVSLQLHQRWRGPKVALTQFLMEVKVSYLVFERGMKPTASKSLNKECARVFTICLSVHSLPADLLEGVDVNRDRPSAKKAEPMQSFGEFTQNSPHDRPPWRHVWRHTWRVWRHTWRHVWWHTWRCLTSFAAIRRLYFGFICRGREWAQAGGTEQKSHLYYHSSQRQTHW